MTLSASAPVHAAACTTEVRTALGYLQAGDPPSAARVLNRAMRSDANQPAAWTVYGIVLLDTSNVRAARRCFERALELDPASHQAAIGVALCDITSGNTATGRARLHAAASHGSDEARLLGDYLACLHDTASLPSSGDASPLAAAVRAYTASREGRTPNWRAALPPDSVLAPPHYPLTASFAPQRPILLRWQPNSRMPQPPAQPKTVLTGTAVLTPPSPADIVRASYDVDGVSVGMTNVSPYSWVWNTAGWPNGWHLVRTTVVFPSGRTVSRERWVITRNPAVSQAPSGPDATELDALIDQALIVQPDARYAHLAEAKAAIARGERDQARLHLQAVVGEDPLYHDAAHLLRAMPASNVPCELWHGDRSQRRIALTFDDGPNPNHTPQLLDVLNRLKIPATFMVVGKQAVKYPDIIRRMAAEGHEVEDHTWNHHNMRKLSEPAALRELAATKILITRLTGRPVRYFRPPGGNIGEAAHEAARALGLTAAMWTFASGKTEGMPLEDMVPRFIHAARPGAIYLIHNGTDKIESLIPIVVRTLQARGWQFVRLDQIATGR